jgi:hypothetical protein
LLQTLSQLGRVQDKQESSKVKHVIAMMFKDNKYVKSELDKFNESSKYLYQRDYSGKPGLFLTGTIPSLDIKQLSNFNTHSKFIKKKILWFGNGKLVNNPSLLDTLSDYRKNELKSIFQELNDKSEQISTDVINNLTSKLPEQTYLTIMINDKFVGEIQDYVTSLRKVCWVRKKIQTTNS